MMVGDTKLLRLSVHHQPASKTPDRTEGSTMIVAGSVLAMLLMGFAVDGFVNPVDGEEDDDNALDDTGIGEANGELGGTGMSLSDLLFSGDDSDDDDALPVETEDDTAAFSYTPLDEVELDHEDVEVAISDTQISTEESLELQADDEWVAAAGSDGGNVFVDIADLIELEDGNEVSLIIQFDTATDELVLDFDGLDTDAPEIEIDHSMEEGAAIVLANGIPVTLVEDAPDLTADHIRVVMSGDTVAQAPLTLPQSSELQQDPREETFEDPLVQPSEPEPDILRDATAFDDPQVQPTGQDVPLDPRDPQVDGPIVIPADGSSAIAGDPTLPEVDRVAGDDGPEILPTSSSVLPDPDTTDHDLPLTDPVETVLDPIITTVDEVTDGLPLDRELSDLLDGVTTGLSDIGDTADMLDARADIDPAFGTGGGDAFTGSFNADLVVGGSGQDALFGDEGNDTLQAGAGNDELHGDTGDDLLEGGEGIDFLDGGEGHDVLDGGANRDLLFGGDGDDVLLGGAAADFLSGGMGADTLNGGSGDDVLNGTFSASDGTDQDDGDVLWGGDGDDTLIIGRDDLAHGGAGADTFVSGDYIEEAEVAGHVADFNPIEDRIEVIFDPDMNPNPRVEVLDFADGSGADILLNGNVILSVSGAQGMDPNLIDLRAVA